MKILVVMMLMTLLTGCGSVTYEVVSDEFAVPEMPQPREVHFFLAEESVMPAMESEAGQLYLCGDYDVVSQTLEGGDLDRTVRAVSGYGPEELTLIQTASGEVDRYEFVWTSCSDGGQQIGRATLLDDGSYHYVLSATIDAELMEQYQEIWNGIFETYELASY